MTDAADLVHRMELRNAPHDPGDVLAKLELDRREIEERRHLGLPTAQQTFASMLKDELAPSLRRVGFTGGGRVFRLPSESHLLAVGFQSSAWNTALEVRFTVNVAAISRARWRATQPAGRTADRLFNPNVIQEGLVPERLGTLAHGADRWWQVRAGAPTKPISEALAQEITESALPWLRRRASAPDA